MQDKNLHISQLIKCLENYTKHSTLEIEVTLKDGEKGILEHNKSIIGRSISCFVNSVRREVSINDILKVEVFSI